METRVSALTSFFFAPVARPTSRRAVLAWWESRRPVYNLCVGAAGLLTLAAAYGFGALPPYPAVVRVPWQIVALYAVMANVCYSAGPLADLWARRAGGERWAVVGPTIFRYGFVFAVGVTLLPIVAAAGSWGVRVLIALTGGALPP
ncbi:hypothetical protein tb265_29660 [Gemmatimonadetes bacterium T265]|nr:hypothetical protein tb265_29660 [Gemmatimonadetes bacterium T265]